VKSKYLICDEVEPGSRVLADGDNPCIVVWVGECFARVKPDDAPEFSIMRNRLTLAADAVDFLEAVGEEIS
jgi:hypothetical protein